MSNQNYLESRVWSGHAFPVLVDFNFIVDNTQTLGIRSLKGAYVSAVYMATTASITGDTHSNTTIDGIADTSGLAVGMRLFGTGIVAGTKIASIDSATAITLDTAATATNADIAIITAAVGNPNPGTGLIVVKLADNYNRFLFSNANFQGALSGSDLEISGTNLTVGNAYVITVVGTSTTAEWMALGVPEGVTPAAGVAFIALKTGSGSGTGVVQAQSAPAASRMAVIGDADASSTPYLYPPSASVKGSWIILQCMNSAGAATAPANGDLVEVQAWMSNSSLTLGGQ